MNFPIDICHAVCYVAYFSNECSLKDLKQRKCPEGLVLVIVSVLYVRIISKTMGERVATNQYSLAIQLGVRL